MYINVYVYKHTTVFHIIFKYTSYILYTYTVYTINLYKIYNIYKYLDVYQVRFLTKECCQLFFFK